MTNAQLANKSQAELVAMVEAMQAKLDAKAKLTLKVAKSGGVSLYGMGRYPVTLYAGQWQKLIGLVKSGEVERFIAAHAGELAVKD